MRTRWSRLLVGVLVGNALSAQPGGLGGALEFDAPPAAPAPASGAPRPPTPPSQPAPKERPALPPEVAARIAGLRQQLDERRDLTLASITPLPTLAACRALATRYRQAVDRTLRQPFLSGLRPAPEWVRQVDGLHARWGTLARAIRAGDPPATIAASRLRELGGEAATGDVPLTGQRWAALSDAYFGEVLAAERQGADLARQVRNSPAMRNLVAAMTHAEQGLQQADGVDEEDSGLLRRSITWDLHRVWRLGMELQIKRLESEGQADAPPPAVRTFLQDMDAARGLRHRGVSLAAAGGAPASRGEPATLVRAPATGQILARLGEAEASVTVGSPVESKLPRLAEELYHTHFTLLQAEVFARDDAREERRVIEALPAGPARDAQRQALERTVAENTAERRRSYEGRRQQLVHEIAVEADRLRARR